MNEELAGSTIRGGQPEGRPCRGALGTLGREHGGRLQRGNAVDTCSFSLLNRAVSSGLSQGCGEETTLLWGAPLATGTTD